MEITVTSKQYVRPNPPTPSQQTHVQLSFLDQLNHSIYVPFIYCYRPSSPQNPNHHLKNSLSKTLSIFFPLAGRLKNDLYVDCSSGYGVPYLEARANTNLSNLIDSPDFDEIHKLLPYNGRLGGQYPSDVPLLVQVTSFACGGIAIGLCFSHKVTDAFSMLMFVNFWAAVSRSDDGTGDLHKTKSILLFPEIGMAEMFPPVSGLKSSSIGFAKEEDVVVKRFVFSEGAISALKAKYGGSSSGYGRLSRVEALAVFISSRFVAANTLGAKPGKRWYRIIQAVNLRPKAGKPIPDSAFGNLSRFVMTDPLYITGDATVEEICNNLIIKMRDALRRIDSNYVNKLQEGNMDPLSEYEKFKNLEGVGISFAFTAIVRFPLYEADFGWGRPIWVTVPEKTMKNVVKLLPTRSSEGVEALLCLGKDDMAKLEVDKEFLSYVTTPSTNIASSKL